MSKAATLRRIARLYATVENMHAIALQQASAGVHEAERAIHAERTAITQASQASRLALAQGEREAWLLAQAGAGVAAVRTSFLETLKTQRTEAESAARADFLASRLQTEQVKQLVTHITTQSDIEESRRTQSTADDRYAARRAWLTSRSRN